MQQPLFYRMKYINVSQNADEKYSTEPEQQAPQYRQ